MSLMTLWLQADKVIEGLGVGNGIAGLVWAAVGAVMLWEKLRGHRNGNGYGRLADVLEKIAVNLAALNERSQHAPTKDDLRQFAEQNRHDARATLTTVLENTKAAVDGACEAADGRDAALHRRLDALPDLLAAKLR